MSNLYRDIALHIGLGALQYREFVENMDTCTAKFRQQQQQQQQQQQEKMALEDIIDRSQRYCYRYKFEQVDKKETIKGHNISNERVRYTRLSRTTRT